MACETAHPVLPPTQPKSLLSIPLSYNPANSQTSASHLLYSLFPEWTPVKGGRGIKFVRFTDGITNTLLKCSHRAPPELSPEEARAYEDSTAVLLRAFGHDTSILIDRDRECASHLLLSQHSLAPPLLARFINGLLYRFVPGRVTSVDELAEPETYTAVAKRLGEWHGVLPRYQIGAAEREGGDMWGVLQKWLNALPTGTDAEKQRKLELQKEVDELVLPKEQGGRGLKGMDGAVGLVTGHCDLLSGNVIILPGEGEKKVHFIDYEYATPCERAFDIANHFSEWGGFACEYERMPTRSTRRGFIRAYLQSFHEHAKDGVKITDSEVDALLEEVDQFRGVPGLYWGIWALVQAMISQIDFDYAGYALVRLGEYHAWKGEESTLREKRWAEE
ncbi:kinase-like protein [Ascodesmis nigricans]|uniref:ethanolamine kinase n=1 Tax=Ascodesmis nigricans TaxID=341454 RepID=A0A4S2N401_9PEZI|nr:kinase-like protein [Ascodesmis nigricans]